MQISEIVDRLYVGSARALFSADNYDLIVNCTVNVPITDKCVKTIRVPVEDLPEENDKLLQHMEMRHVLEAIHECLEDKNHYVLVHCHAGRQRSCAVIACYLIKYHNMTAMDAVKHIKSRHREAFFGGINFADAINKFYDSEKRKTQEVLR